MGIRLAAGSVELAVRQMSLGLREEVSSSGINLGVGSTVMVFQAMR